MNEQAKRLICQTVGCEECEPGEVIQSLWSGYGVIQKVTLVGSKTIPAVVKLVDLGESRANRRGWAGDVSHMRKVNSYSIEKEFYGAYSTRCPSSARVPNLIGAAQLEDQKGWVIVLEDLDAAGFSVRKRSPNLNDIKACLAWLANFHAAFMNSNADGLWPTGTYWHLETRPDELAAMDDGPLKQSAAAIDRKLNDCEFQTLVHGDAKVANFCFADQESSFQPVAAVDFQYVGRGCGMKDVAYFMSSCLGDDACEREMEGLLSFYFANLKEALDSVANLSGSPNIASDGFDRLEQQWRSLFPVAWADFNRFLMGWSPGHWKLTSFSKRMTTAALRTL